MRQRSLVCLRTGDKADGGKEYRALKLGLKRCEENTDGKTKRGENIKGNDVCESCQTRQRRELSKAARHENGHASK